MQEQLLKNLATSERLTELYINKKRESLWVNRVKKFWRQPYKYIYQNALKIGVIKNAAQSVRMFWGKDLILPISDDNVVLAYYCGSLGLSESDLARFFITHITPGDVFYDIGANYGYYSALADTLGAEVHAFEPNPSVLPYLRKNILPNATLNEVALADKAGYLTFSDISASHKSGMSTLFPEILPEENRRTQKLIKVPALTLDEYVVKHTPPTIIKMDVENAECLVLEGSRKLLTQYSPIIAMEVYDDTVSAATDRTRRAVSILQELGYRSYEIGKDAQPTPAEIRLGNMGASATFIFRKD